MKPSPQEILELAQRIVDAEATLAGLRLKWDAYFPDDSPAQPQLPLKAPARKPGGKPRQPGSLQGTILTVMESEPTRTYTAEDFVAQLGADRQKVGNTLAKLAYKKKIFSRGRGVYSAEQYIQDPAA